MTLNTRVAVREPVPLQELFMQCRTLIGAEDDKWQWEDRENWNKDGSRTLGMKGWQGLPGWLMIDYRPDGPLRAKDNEPYFPEDGDEEPETDPEQIRPACAYEVSLDTGYSYRGANGDSCTQLHCRFILGLAAWLDERGYSCRWQNEYAGTWHDPDNENAFKEFLGGGESAMSWFGNVVMPAIESGLLR